MTEEREALASMLKTVASMEAKAVNVRTRYFEENGEKLPYYIRQSVDGGWRELYTSYETAKIMVSMIEGLKARVELFEKHVDNLEDILVNGPGSETKEPEPVKAKPPIEGDSKWEPNEQQLKQLSTDGRID